MPRACLAFDRPGLERALADNGIDSGASPHGATLLIGSCAAADVDALLGMLRQRCPVPVLLVVEGDEEALIAAINSGADDAVSANVSDRLIAARAAALIRRATPRLLTLGELAIDLVERRVWRAGKPIDLLPREYRLLLELAQRPGESIGRAVLLKRVCGINFDPGTNVLEVHISRLRAKIDRGFATPMLLTDKGIGYRLAVEPCDTKQIEATSVAS